MSDINANLADGIAATKRVCAEAHAARHSWALFSAINGETPQEREQLREATCKLGLSTTLNFLEMTFIREVILALFRITDPASTDRLTLVRIAKLLDDDELIKNRLNVAREWIPNSPEKLAEFDRLRCEEAIASLKNCVNDWQAPPTDACLYSLRNKLRPVRDKILAHSIAASQIEKPTRVGVFRFLAIVSKLASAAQLIFLDGASPWEDDLKGRRKEAAEFWDYLQDGIVTAVSDASSQQA